VEQQLFTRISCPLCAENSFSHFLSSRDYFLTQEEFHISECNKCGLRFTNPIPSENTIGRYYQSVDYISHSESSQALVDKIYYFIRDRSFKRKLDIIKRHLANEKGNLLDYGCGTGDFLRYCIAKGWLGQGIEVSEKARHVALRAGLKVAETADQARNFGPFNVITLWHVLEHLPDLTEVGNYLRSSLHDHGRLIIAVPNLRSRDARIYKERWAAYDLPRHLYHFDRENLDKFATRNHFVIEETYSLPYDSFYVSLLSEKYRGRNGLTRCLFAGWQGLLSNLSAMRSGEFSSIIYVLKPLVRK
jgi:SAM-dependent methyltransferase